jgi:hypothetical protein
MNIHWCTGKGSEKHRRKTGTRQWKTFIHVLEEEMIFREKADASQAARAIGFNSPASGGDSNDRPLSVDFEHLSCCPDQCQWYLLVTQRAAIPIQGGLPISAICCLSDLCLTQIEMTESKRVQTSQATRGNAEPRPSRSLQIPPPMVAISSFESRSRSTVASLNHPPRAQRSPVPVPSVVATRSSSYEQYVR